MSSLHTLLTLLQSFRRIRPIPRSPHRCAFPRTFFGSGRTQLPQTSNPSPRTYIDQWFESIKKPQSFYDKWTNGRIRRYFYNVDLQGRIFLEETSPKNIATSIKDEKFLNFFFSRIRSANEQEMNFLMDNDILNDYPFVSQCGVEINFIRPAATPVVFHALREHGEMLLYGGNLQQAFDRSKLAVSKTTGRLYHRLDRVQTRPGGQEWIRDKKMEYGLIRSSVAVALSEKISVGSKDNFFFDDRHEIGWLSDENEPGTWAMPDDGTVG